MKFFLALVLIIQYFFSAGQSQWVNPIVKLGRTGSPLVETSPFVFKNRLYLLENNQKFWDVPGAKPGDFFHEDEIRIRDIEKNRVVSVPLKNHAFGTVLVHDGNVYIFAGNYGKDKPWRQISEVVMTSSTDLKRWSKPVTVYSTTGNEYIYNTAVCRGKDSFVLLVETNDRRWPAFTFKYYTSDDLVAWTEVPEGVYGRDKYVGGPALYYEGGWYYTLYLEKVKGGYDTRITRSQDLVNWEDARHDRPFVTFDPAHRNIPLINPDIAESNASDVELTYFKGQTIIYFTGSDQTTAGDLQRAVFDGTPQELFEHFFKEQGTSDLMAPKHEGDWMPVLLAPGENLEIKGSGTTLPVCMPSARQLAYQERQLGAFIHFGPATFVSSDFMSVPAAEIFNPVKLDAEQWVKAAVSFGARHIVLTAKHHNGFCLWPTKTTGYSVKSSPWKNGQGDVVAEFVAACRKYGVKPGLYLSGCDKHFGCWSTGDPMGKRKAVGDVHAYFPLFLEQLRELLTNYGDIDIVWFDGAYDPFGWDIMNPETMERLGTAYGDAIRAMVNHLQPQAVVFGSTRPDIRWSGSEQGWAPYPLWNCVTGDDWNNNWVGPENLGWIAAEANIHTRRTWFWTPGSDGTLKNKEQMFQAYMESIGRGANLLINMTPDTLGIIPRVEVETLGNFGAELRRVFGEPVAYVSNPVPSGGTIELVVPGTGAIGFIEIEEDLNHGQNILAYSLEYFQNGRWLNIAEGMSVGRKRLHQTNNIDTEKIRLVIRETSGYPVVRRFAAY